MDDVLRMVAGLGKGALLAKFDVENAYRNVPVHPDDRAKLGMKWRKQLYLDLMLLFGLRSAPFIFDSIAEVVEWILTTNYSITNLLHYLDDFLTAGPPNSRKQSVKIKEICRTNDVFGDAWHRDRYR